MNHMIRLYGRSRAYDAGYVTFGGALIFGDAGNDGIRGRFQPG